MIPSEFREKYLNGTLGLFDGIVTFPSVKHSCLGRIWGCSESMGRFYHNRKGLVCYTNGWFFYDRLAI